MSETEEWRPVVGHEDTYEVSNLGRVRSRDRLVTMIARGGRQARSKRHGRALKPNPARGYLRVALGHPAHHVGIHRLVLEAFVGPCPDGHMCAHGDGRRDNNNLSNLRWATGSENQADRYLHGTMLLGEQHPAGRKTHCKNGHPFDEANTRRRSRGGRDCRACHRDRCRERRLDPAFAALERARDRERMRQRLKDPAKRERINAQRREATRRRASDQNGGQHVSAW